LQTLINQRWKWYEKPAEKFLKQIIDKYHLKLKKAKHIEDDEEGKATDIIINLSVYAVDEEGFILSAYSQYIYSTRNKISDRLMHSIRRSNKSEGVVLKLIKPKDKNGVNNKLAYAKKLTEVKIDLFSYDKDFIVKVISILLAKIKDEIEIRAKQ
jgi:hypothetical protein